jgi:trigger factor
MIGESKILIMNSVMDITKEQVDNLNAIVRIKLTPEDYEPKVEKALKDYSRKVQMPGFRPGKVPFSMVKKMYGKSIMADEINKMLSDSLYHFLEENKIEILGNPLPRKDADIDWDNQREFEFSYDLGLVPQFDLKLDSKKTFERSQIKVEDKDIQQQIDDISKRYGKLISPDSVGENDIVYVDFAELDEAANEKENGIKHSSTMILTRIKSDAVKEKLTGSKVGDQFTANAKDLSENPTDLASMLNIDKEAAENITSDFSVAIKNISRIEPHALDQELFDKVFGEGKVTSEEEFKNKVVQEIQAMYQNDIDSRLFNDISKYLIEVANISLPDEFLKRWMQTVAEKPVTLEEIESDYEKYTQAMKWQLIENKLIKDNNVQVSNEEATEFTKNLIRDQYARYGQINVDDEELGQQAKRIMSNKEELKRIFDRLYDKKLMDLFKDTYKFKEKEVTPEEFFKG